MPSPSTWVIWGSDPPPHEPPPQLRYNHPTVGTTNPLRYQQVLPSHLGTYHWVLPST